MFLLPGERERIRTPTAIGLRIVSRDAAMRRGVPYAMVRGPVNIGVADGAPIESQVPWWVWVAAGGAALAVAYYALRKPPVPKAPEFVVLSDRYIQSAEPFAQTSTALPPGEVGYQAMPAALPPSPWSPDATLAADFDRRAAERWLWPFGEEP